MESPSEITSYVSPISRESYYNYRLISNRGRYSTGTVVGFGRRWFVKSLSEPFKEISQCKADLRKEYEILIGLNHPGIVRVVGLEELPETGLAILMEYVEGESFDTFCKKLSGRQRGEVGRQLIEAIACLHSNGIVHSDLKPENILVGGSPSSPRLKIIDFNLSDGESLAHDKALGGNRKYGAPEQFEGTYSPSPTADIWSIGLLLKELKLKSSWKPVIRSCLKKEPFMRFAEASEILPFYKKTKRKNLLLYVILLTAIGVGLVAVPLFMIFRNTPESVKTDGSRPVTISSEATMTPLASLQPTESVTLSIENEISAETFTKPLIENTERTSVASTGRTIDTHTEESMDFSSSTVTDNEEDFRDYEAINREFESILTEMKAVEDEAVSQLHDLLIDESLTDRERGKKISQLYTSSMNRIVEGKERFMKLIPANRQASLPQAWHDFLYLFPQKLNEEFKAASNLN